MGRVFMRSPIKQLSVARQVSELSFSTASGQFKTAGAMTPLWVRIAFSIVVSKIVRIDWFSQERPRAGSERLFLQTCFEPPTHDNRSRETTFWTRLPDRFHAIQSRHMVIDKKAPDFQRLQRRQKIIPGSVVPDCEAMQFEKQAQRCADRVVIVHYTNDSAQGAPHLSHPIRSGMLFLG